jgi:hypothetical protein
MTTRTRYFVIASLLTMGVGLGAGLLAYSLGFETSAFSRQGGPEELQFVPATAAVVAYADVRGIMASDLRQKIRALMPSRPEGRQEFQTRTGINIETDVDHVVVAFMPGTDATDRKSGAAIVLARGRFDQAKIQSLMESHGATVDDYKGTRLISGAATQGRKAVSVAFLEPGLAAIGSSVLVRDAVDLKSGGASIATNEQVMGLVRDIGQSNAWAAGRFDALTSQGAFPAGVAQQMPSISLFSASARIDGGLSATLRADTRDEDAANGLRDVVRGFIALAKMQSSGHPEFATALQAIQLGGAGKTVSLSFDLPPAALDALSALRGTGDRTSNTPQH